MTLFDSFPAASSAADQLEIGKELAALMCRDSSGAPRAGVFYDGVTTALVTAKPTMQVDVVAFLVAGSRDKRAIWGGNDGTVQVAIGAAPGANARYDVVYWKQLENGYGGYADGSNGPVLGVQVGAVGPSPVEATVIAAIPAGAVPLASLYIPTGVSATNAGTVVIRQIAPFTALRGDKVAFRSTTDMNLWTTAVVDQEAIDISSMVTYRWNGTAWKPWNSDWIALTGVTHNVVVGTGGIALIEGMYSNGRLRVRYRFTLGSASFTMPTTPELTFPFNLRAPGGGTTSFGLFDGFGQTLDFAPPGVGPGTFHRHNAAAVAGAVTKVAIIMNLAAPAVISPTTPFTWAASDVLHGEFWADLA